MTIIVNTAKGKVFLDESILNLAVAKGQSLSIYTGMSDEENKLFSLELDKVLSEEQRKFVDIISIDIFGGFSVDKVGTTIDECVPCIKNSRDVVMFSDKCRKQNNDWRKNRGFNGYHREF